MTTLTAILTDPERRPAAVAALSEVVDQEVASKSGLSGAALKTAVGAATKVRPGVIPAAISRLLPDFATALEPYWAGRGDASFADHLVANGDAAADALLAVTDEKIAGPDGGRFGKIYGAIRPKAHSNVVAALPRLGAAIEKLAV